MTSGKGASLLATSLLSVVLLSHSTDALRRFTATETKAARALHAKAGSASANNTAYGEPIVELRLKPTAINHFSAVSSALKHYLKHLQYACHLDATLDAGAILSQYQLSL